MDELVAAALEARDRAYAPYSRFPVGAAVRSANGAVHAGCNVENAAYPQGVCAEAGAISAMVLAGGQRITAVVGAGAGPRAVMPCGGCRQKLREFAAPGATVRIVDEAGHSLVSTTLAALLPMSFGPENLA